MGRFVLFLSAALTLSLLALIIFFESRNASENEENFWTSTIKTDGQIVETTPPEDLLEPSSRKPASVKPLESPLVTRNGRAVEGAQIEIYKDPRIQLPMSNSPREDWKEDLSEKLMAWTPEGAKLDIRHDRSLIRVNEGKGRYLEEATVQFTLPGGAVSSYKAVIDPETLEMIQIWDRARFERSPASAPNLSPTGVLR
jgi:hypothetical protein